MVRTLSAHLPTDSVNVVDSLWHPACPVTVTVYTPILETSDVDDHSIPRGRIVSHEVS